MTLEQAMELAEEYFSFDYLGDAMMDVRREPDDESLRAELAQTLAEVMHSESGEEEQELFDKVSKVRVEQFVTSVKSASGTGCGK